MSDQRNTPPPNPRGGLLPITLAFLAGLICGVAITVYKLKPAEAPPHAERAQFGEMAEALEAEVARDPDNLEAWTQLGNIYFDIDEPGKAIVAYEKALTLDPDNADILTDLGVMYQRTGQPERALALFDRAISADPSHDTARFNKGVVLMHDLKDPGRAIAEWKALSEINPVFTAPNGQSLDEVIRHYTEHEAAK